MIFFLKDKYKKGSIEYNLIEYTENNWKFIIDNSMIDVAKKLYIHPSTLTRTVQKLGFKKYNNFRHYILVQSKEYQDLDSLLTKKNFEDTVKNIYQANKFVIEKTYKNLNLENFEEVIKVINNADRIITFGLGFSGYLGSQLCKYLRILGKECVDLTNIYDLLKFATDSNEGTWLIISRTLTTKEIVFGLDKILQNSNNEVILLTSNRTNIPKKVQYSILFQSLDESDHYFGLSSKISLLFIINLILITVIGQEDVPLISKVDEFNLITKEWKK